MKSKTKQLSNKGKEKKEKKLINQKRKRPKILKLKIEENEINKDIYFLNYPYFWI